MEIKMTDSINAKCTFLPSIRKYISVLWNDMVSNFGIAGQM
uniref:Uncharacterized protein n=1 Tax=Anguilla anguilla TaxID=7936 RepID=A0A0E9P8Y9_ANGAN